MPDAVDVQIRCFVSLDLSDGNGGMSYDPEQMHIPDREPRLHGVLAPPCRKGAPLFHEQF